MLYAYLLVARGTRAGEYTLLLQAIKVADRNFATFATNAHKTAVHFAARNGSARFANALVAAAKSRTRPFAA